MNILTRRFVTKNPPRGSLTFLADGQVILGMAYKEPTEEEVELFRDRIQAYMRDPKKNILVLPFPVDVIDNRVRS